MILKGYKFLLLITLCCCHCALSAQSNEVKQFDQTKYEELVNSVDYSAEPEIDKSKRWEINWGLNIPPGLSKLLLYIFIPVIIIAMFFLIRNQTKYQTTQRNSLVDIRNLENENLEITEINFDDLLSMAILNGDYKLAIRTLYLRSLQKLSSANYISWKLDKTNRQYTRELKGNERLASPFRNLTREYEIYWYGERHLDANQFANIHSLFQSFDKELFTTEL